jgi:chromosome segregation ATPase
MEMLNVKTRCSICDKEKRAVRCEGCLQLFCYDHLTCHRKELTKQLDHIEANRDIFRQTLHEQRNHPEIHSLIKQINKWEHDSIKTVQETANECRQVLIQHRNEHFNDIETNLAKLTDELRDICQENDFNEIDLNIFDDKLKQLQKELDKISNISIQHDSTPLIHRISVVVSPGKLVNHV